MGITEQYVGETLSEQKKTGRFKDLPVLKKNSIFNLFDIGADNRGNLHHINGLTFF